MYTLCSFETIQEGESKGFDSPLGPIFAIKKKQTLYLYANNCPHMNISLEWEDDSFLDSSKQLIQCATHGAQFLIESGHCIYGPCKGRKLRPIPYELDANNNVCLLVNATA